MNYFKLQLGCLVIVLYVIGIYVKQTSTKGYKCNKIYDALMYVCPWAIVFDGVTSWTVNHLELVPEWVNLTCHGIFFITLVLSLGLVFFLILDYTVGIPTTTVMKIAIHTPIVSSIVLILIFLKDLYYVQGKITNYSMGISVIVTYASLFLHFALFTGIVIWKHKSIEKRKLPNIIVYIAITLAVVLTQMILPETLISSILPTLCIVCFYISIEDPALVKLEAANAEMVTGFATLVENRDNSTGGHITRTKKYVELILNEMTRLPRYNEYITKDYVKDVIAAAPMHDIGKISTPDSILQKPGKLTDEEFEIMKQHSAKGGEIIRETFSEIEDVNLKDIAYEVARYHHEKWNGKGYPDGLKEEEIPLHARIMAIADVFDAVSAKRCYRDALPLEVCFNIIEEGRGRDFDPDLTDVFLGARDKVVELYYDDDCNK